VRGVGHRRVVADPEAPEFLTLAGHPLRWRLLGLLRTEGPTDADSLQERLAARFWEPGRFERALAHAVADGLVVRSGDGRYAAV